MANPRHEPKTAQLNKINRSPRCVFEGKAHCFNNQNLCAFHFIITRKRGKSSIFTVTAGSLDRGEPIPPLNLSLTLCLSSYEFELATPAFYEQPFCSVSLRAGLECLCIPTWMGETYRTESQSRRLHGIFILIPPVMVLASASPMSSLALSSDSMPINMLMTYII